MPLSDPGYVNDVAFGGDVDPDWGNAIRDRVVHHFASAAARDLAITSPKEGMACWLADVDQFLIYNGVAWRKPWSTQWGEQQTAANTAGIDISNTEATIVSVTFTAVANRIYGLEFQAGHLQPVNTTAGEFVKVKLTDNSNALINLFGQRGFDDTSTGLPGDAQRTSMHAVRDVLGLSAGSTTLKARAVLSGASGSARFSATSSGDPGPISLTVHDRGPNGAAA